MAVKNSKRIAMALADGKPRTAAQLRAELGLSRDEFLSAAGSLSRKKLLKRVPVTYAITATGATYANHSPLTAAARVKNSRAKQAKMHAEDRERTQKLLESVVDSALASRPALQAAWG